MCGTNESPKYAAYETFDAGAKSDAKTGEGQGRVDVEEGERTLNILEHVIGIWSLQYACHGSLSLKDPSTSDILFIKLTADFETDAF